GHAEVVRHHGRPDDVAIVAEHLETDRRVEVERALEVRGVHREVEDRLHMPVRHQATPRPTACQCGARSSVFLTLPLALRGSSGTNATLFGTLKLASRSR